MRRSCSSVKGIWYEGIKVISYKKWDTINLSKIETAFG